MRPPHPSRRSPRLIDIRFLASLIAACCLLACVAVPAADASRNQTTFFEAPRDLKDPSTLDTALGELDGLGVKAVRQVLTWRDVAPSPSAASKPDFDATDPSAYNWATYDRIVQAVHARGWKLLLTVSGPAPRWATQGHDPHGLVNPSAAEFAQFMTAVARHYEKNVDVWSIWNEPNQPQFLLPQYDSKHRPVSPQIYRGLYKAALKGFASAKLSNPRVLIGETSPRGNSHVVAPLAFMRGMLCLSKTYKLQKGCDKLQASGYAHHAYTTRQGPFFSPPQKDDVTIGVLSRLTQALTKAGRAGAITPNLDVYLTEFGIQSVPDPLYGVSQPLQAEYRATSERLAYDNPRVAAFSQYLLRDDAPLPNVPPTERYSGFESGLQTSGGKDKLSYDAFRLTLAARKKSKSSASVWGLVRPATSATKATLEYRDGGRGDFRALKNLDTNRLGYFTVSVGYRKGRQYRLAWTGPGGDRLHGAPTAAFSK